MAKWIEKKIRLSAEVLGISGSPTKNSNTDRRVKAIMDACGLVLELIKLSGINVRPCCACKQRVPDNICKFKDDFQALAEKIRSARGLIIGGDTPYGQIDGFTKALLERFWSFKHRNNLLKGKLCGTALTGVDPRAMDAINRSWAAEIRGYEHMELVGQLSVQGNLPCLTCGEGDTCEMSGVKVLRGPDAKTAAFGYARVEDQDAVWKEAIRIGLLIGERSKMVRSPAGQAFS